jgi:hypothetical protein
MDNRVYDQPSSVEAIDDRVSVDGRDGVDVALTPEAAEETGHRLLDEAAHAAGNRHLKASSS